MTWEEKSILVAASGGLDSTWLLDKLLTQTDKRVGVLIVNFAPAIAAWEKNQSQLDLMKLDSRVALAVVPRVVDWLSEHRRPIRGVNIIPAITLLHNESKLSAIIRALGHTQIMSAWDEFATGKTEDHQRSRERERDERYKGAMLAHTGKSLRFPLLDDHETRVHAMTHMDPALQALTVSCLRPRFVGNSIVDCGECMKCKATPGLRARIAAGDDLSKVEDDYLKECNAGRHFNGGEQGRSAWGKIYV